VFAKAVFMMMEFKLVLLVTIHVLNVMGVVQVIVQHALLHHLVDIKTGIHVPALQIMMILGIKIVYNVIIHAFIVQDLVQINVLLVHQIRIEHLILQINVYVMLDFMMMALIKYVNNVIILA